jgi:FlaG/FlaF family flagellin (archaellin)
MSVRIPGDQIINPQQLETIVAGPDGANRLFIVTGQLNTSIGASSQGPYSERQETFTVLVGPVFTRQQFYKAVATAAITNTTYNINPTNPESNNNFSAQLNSADADWDDESGQVELSIELKVGTSGSSNYVQITSVSYQVSILGAVTNG